MTEFEIIELPADRAQDKLPIDVQASDIDAWPDRRLRFRFDYSNVEQRWIWQVDLLNRGTIIPRQPVMYLHPYVFRDWLMFMFVDPSRKAETVTHDNLGDPVLLTVFPGPRSPAYDEWWGDSGETTDEQTTQDEPPILY